MRQRSVVVPLALAVAACTDGQERPATLEVVTLTILAPNCGQVMCHSTTTRREDLAFDTVEDARLALIALDVDTAVAANRPLEHDFMNVLTGDGLPRMPPDTPLFAEDIELIRTWLVSGAPGL